MINLGFISPSGEMYTCQPFEHLDLAKELCSKLGYLDDIEKINKFYSSIDCENYLLAKGFLCIYSRNITHGCVQKAQIGNATYPYICLSSIQEKFIKNNLTNAFNMEQLDAMHLILDRNNYLNEAVEIE